jgi:hypothetical protein
MFKSSDKPSIAFAGVDPTRRKAATDEACGTPPRCAGENAPNKIGVQATPPYLSAEYLRAALRAEAARLRLVLAEIELAEIGVREGWMSAQNAFDLFERSGVIEFLEVAS